MGWQTEVAIQLQAGDTIINASGLFTYSAAPAAGNLIGSVAPAAGTDQFGNHYLQGVSAYGASFASSLNGGFLSLYNGSLAAGWGVAAGVIETDVSQDLILIANGQVQSSGNFNVLGSYLQNGTVFFDGTNMTVPGSLSVNGSTSTGAGDNGGVTSGPSGTVNAFPAAGPNHTHAELHHHPL